VRPATPAQYAHNLPMPISHMLATNVTLDEPQVCVIYAAIA
jgi:hypothetical protein